MTETLNRAPKFRADLKREIPLWLREGLIDEGAAYERYLRSKEAHI